MWTKYRKSVELQCTYPTLLIWVIRVLIKAYTSTKVQGLMSLQRIGTYRSNKFPLSVEAQVPPRFFRVYCQFDTEVQRLYGEISCKRKLL